VSESWAAFLAAVVAGCAGVLGALVENWRHQKVNESTAKRTAVDMSVDTAHRVVELLREQLETQAEELDAARGQIAHLTAELVAARGQITHLTTDLDDARREIHSMRDQVANLEALVATLADPKPGGRRATDPPD
jgi:chromosome segregation ATPase